MPKKLIQGSIPRISVHHTRNTVYQTTERVRIGGGGCGEVEWSKIIYMSNIQALKC